MQHLEFTPDAATVGRYLADKSDSLHRLGERDYRAAAGILAGIDRLDLPEDHPLACWRDLLRTKAQDLAQPGSTGF